MANIQVKNVPDELHERLRRHARKKNCTMSAAVLAAIEREIDKAEWLERLETRPVVDLGPGETVAEAIQAERALRDKELGLG